MTTFTEPLQARVINDKSKSRSGTVLRFDACYTQYSNARGKRVFQRAVIPAPVLAGYPLK